MQIYRFQSNFIRKLVQICSFPSKIVLLITFSLEECKIRNVRTTSDRMSYKNLFFFYYFLTLLRWLSEYLRSGFCW